MLKLCIGSRVTITKGFSLVELLITLLLGSILLTMVISLYTTGISTGTKSLKYSRLRTDLQSIVAMMESDIRRAGYGGKEYLVGVSANKSIDINDHKNCIVYYYNHDASSTLTDNNRMSFAFKDDAIKFKTGVGKVANDVCVIATGWTSISDKSFVAISKLTFTEFVTSNAMNTARNVKIELAGELVADRVYTHTITTRAQVRNIEFN